MAEPADSAPEPVEGEVVDEAAVVRHLPMPVEPAPSAELDRPWKVSLPAAAAAAGGGFVLGVATFVLVRVLRRPGAARRLARKRRRLIARRRGVDVESTRSFLVDVHLLKR
jgi:hypothetical protein